MGTKTAGLSTAIKALQVELDSEMAKSRVGLRFGLETENQSPRPPLENPKV